MIFNKDELQKLIKENGIKTQEDKQNFLHEHNYKKARIF